MADYDVGILTLSSPPSLAVITSYRPAVSVRNNGIHDALASGTLRIYSAGLLIFTTELYSSTIAPGATVLAQGVDYWTPPALGKYQVIAYVTCPLDQIEANNSLAPTIITIIEGEAPTPPAIPLHAAQHEEGGTDEVIVDGLHGRLTDKQTPLEHNTSHQVAGHDELDLTGMHGVLADGQPIADHAATHEPLGGDVLNVDGLHGELYNVQKPKTHGNEAHDPNYAKTPHGNEAHTPDFENAGVAAAKIATHDADNNSHDSSTKLEHKSDKGAANGYASLGAGTLVPHAQLGSGPIPGETPRFLRDDQAWVEQTTAAHKTTHQALGSDEISVAGLTGTLATQQSPIGHHLRHEAGGDDVITALGPHHSSHELNGSDKISIAGLSGVTGDAQTPVGHHLRHEPGGDDAISGVGAHHTTHEPGGSDPVTGIPPSSHSNTVHEVSTNQPGKLITLDIGTPGSATAVARADHIHTGPGCVKTEEGASFSMWNTPRPMIDIEIGNGLYTRRGLLIDTIWRGSSFGYVNFTTFPQHLEMYVRLIDNGTPVLLAMPSVLIPIGLPNQVAYFMLDTWCRGRAAGMNAWARLTVGTPDGSLALWSIAANFGSAPGWNENLPTQLEIAAKMNPYGGPDAGVVLSSFELLYSPV